MANRYLPAEVRFARNVDKTDSCWLWTASTFARGHGRIKVDGRAVVASRYAWELEHGPIPDGLLVCHHCDEPRCVRVSHLFLGTPADNMHDRDVKGRHYESNRTHCPQGHAYDEKNTRVTAKGWRKCRACERTRATAARIARSEVPG